MDLEYLNLYRRQERAQHAYMNNASLRSPAVLLAFACVYLIWGTTFLGIAIAIETLPPFTSGAIRFLLAALLMYAWLRLRGAHPLANVNWRHAALCGVLLTGFGNGLVVWAQQGVPSGIAALVVASIPVFVLAFNWLFFEKRAPSVTAAVGIALAALGVAAIVYNTRTLTGTAQPLHIVALLCAVCAWSAGTLLQKRLLRGDIFAFTCAQIFFGGVLQASLALLNGEWRDFDIARVSTASMMALSYLIVLAASSHLIVTRGCYRACLRKQSPRTRW
jgi:drug/metabolite transporter (DMT)-like permease